MQIPLLRLVVPLFLALPAFAQPSLPDRVIPACPASNSSLKHFSWSKRIAYTLPTKDAKLHRGKVDVDYVRDAIQRKSTSAFMSLWSGPMAFSPTPPKDLTAKTPSFSQRELHAEDGKLFGKESFGVTTDGKHWRHTFLVGEGLHGIEYEVSSQEDADFFDRIIDSVCELPASRDSH